MASDLGDFPAQAAPWTEKMRVLQGFRRQIATKAGEIQVLCRAISESYLSIYKYGIFQDESGSLGF